MYLNVKAFALTCGIMWGIAVCGLTWWLICFEGATKEKTIIGRVYRGYNISPRGSIIGMIWGFFDGLVGGAVIAWLYNWIAAFFIN